ncbi:MAG: gliding motility protein GldL [Bacteroidota bacterium]|nr:gliding motility protein GldL [Bacteroidota bacterium]
MNLTEIVQSKVYKGFMAKLYGWGASVVLLGALFKINHYQGAGTMLLIGLSVEAAIFFFSAFEPLHEQYDWSLVYPELAGMDDSSELVRETDKGLGSGSIADMILEKAEISKETLEKLGAGINNLSDTTAALSDVADASIATKEYVDSAQKASETMQGISQSSETYQELAQNLGDNLNSVSEGSTKYAVQIESMNKHLTALNAVYEMQLQGTNKHFENSTEAYDGLGKMMNNLKLSVASTEKYKDEVTKLGDKLEALNTIYGNMLSAMNLNK